MSSSSKQSNWIDIAEWGAIAASVGGTIAASLLQQIALATIPLSITAVLSVCNRRQVIHKTSLEMSRLETTILQQKDELKNIHQHLIPNIREKQDTESLRVSLQLQECGNQIEKLQSITRDLRIVTNCSQHISSEITPVASYYERAIGHHRLGDLQEAILDYSEAISRDKSHGRAYFNRGIAHINVGDKQKAVEDLRNAAKVFFKQGNIGAYSKAKELSENTHELGKQESPEDFEAAIGEVSPSSQSTAERLRSQETSSEEVVMQGLFS